MPTPTPTAKSTTQAITQATAQAPAQSRRQSQKAADRLKLIVFPMGQLRLAVPMNNISRVINCPKVYSSGLNAAGVSTVGDRELTIVNLHQQLFGRPAPSTPERPGYLVLSPSPTGELIGIPTPETPLLLEVTESQVRELPQSYRQADTLWVASHMIRSTLEEGGELQSIFMLDMAAVMNQLLSKA